MALTLNTASVNAIATSLGALFNNGTVEIRTSADVVLATISLGATAFGAASGGVISKNGTWSATASASGIAAKGVFISSDTLKTATVTVATSAADMIIDNANIVTGGTVTITAYSKTVPAS